MTIAARHLEFIGVSLFGPPPLGWVHVSFDVGVTTLYGKNGVGKTRLLKALKNALLGVSTEDSIGLLHVRVPEVGELYDDPWRNEFESALRSHFVDARGRRIGRITDWRDNGFEDDETWGEALHALAEFTAEIEGEGYSPTTVSELVRAHISQMRFGPNEMLDKGTWGEIAVELADRGIFTLLASGTESAREWRVFSAGTTDFPIFGQIFLQDREYYSILRRLSGKLGGTSEMQSEAMDLFKLASRLRSGFPWEESSPVIAVVEGSLPGQAGVPFLSKKPWPEPWPDWASIPAVEVGRIHSIPVSLMSEDSDPSSANLTTRDALLALAVRGVIEVASDQEVVYTEDVQAAIERISDLATRLLSQILMPSPPLRLDLGGPAEWFRGRPPRWELKDEAADLWLDLSAGSAAQIRWALLAIVIACELVHPDGRPVVLLADEPEAGLHAAAEANLPSALSHIAAELNAAVVVATHSADMLNERSLTPTHVTRINGYALARPMPIALGDAIDRQFAADLLGITRSAMLQMIRCFVAVEGLHDRMVIEALIGDELRTARAAVLPLGGGRAAPSLADATLLFDYTDANVVVVLDGIALETVAPIWETTVAHAQRGEIAAARRELARLEELDCWEAKWLRELLDKAIIGGTWSRLVPAPLREPDIICYLPPSFFAPGKTWSELLADWRNSYPPGRASDLKTWLRALPNKPAVGRRAIERALREAVPHHDLLELAAVIRSASG